MTISNNISPIIQKFMMNEINVIIQKYNNVKQDEVESIEELLNKINDEELKEELLKDFDKVLNLAREIGTTNISADEIKMYLWLRKYIDKEIQISEVIRYSEDIESNGYVELDKTSIIYKRGYCLKDLERETMKGLKENGYKCLHNGGTPPLGYDVNEEKRYVINEKEAESVRIIFQMTINGNTRGEIIKELNERGYKTKLGTAFRPNSIHSILTNEKYTGVYIYNRSAKKDVFGKRNSHTNKDESEIIRIEGGMQK